jgi:hypothetical protein
MSASQRVSRVFLRLVVVTALTPLMLSLSVAARAEEKITLTCKGSETIRTDPNNYTTYVDNPASITVDLTEGVVNFDGTLLPITNTAEGAISFDKKDVDGGSFIGSIDRITGSAFLSQHNGEMTVVTRLKCSKAKPLF